MKFAGARWWKFDFHSHTPSSSDYGRRSEDPDGQKMVTPREWLLKYMSKEVDCVAVTDHNCGEWIDKLQAELKSLQDERPEGYRDIYIFPGVEITASGGTHLLAIFSEEKNSAYITTLMGSIDCQMQGPNAERVCSESIEKIATHVSEKEGVLIAAHVDKESGLFTKGHNGPTLTNFLQRESVLGLEVIDDDFALPRLLNEKNIELARVQGSDSHDLESIGRRYTWVKMEVPNFEALKLALHDGDDGVLINKDPEFNPNELKNRFYIRRISVSEAAKAGRGPDSLTIEFSPWMTTIIGGRGSGKSSILNFLRMVFNKSEGLPKATLADFKSFTTKNKERGKVGMISRDTEIEVEFYKDGQDIKLIWSNESTQEQRFENGEWSLKESSGNISERFPIRVFNQKQIYEMTGDPNAILALIDQNIDKAAWDENKLEYEDQWLQSKRGERSTTNEIAKYKEERVRLRDIEAKLKVFESADKDKILENFKTFESQHAAFKSFLAMGNYFSDEISRSLSDLPTFPDEIEITFLKTDRSDALKGAIEKWNTLRGKVQDLVIDAVAAKQDIDSLVTNSKWYNENEEVRAKYSRFVEEFGSQVDEYSDQGMKSYDDLVGKRIAIQKRVGQLDELEKRAVTQKEASEQLFHNIVSHEMKLREDRKKVIADWTKGSAGSHVKVTLHPMGDLKSAEDDFRKLIRKTNGEFSKDILQIDGEEHTGLLSAFSLQRIEIWQTRDKLISRLNSLFEGEDKVVDRRFIKHLEQIQKESPEDFDRLMAWFPEDSVSLELKVEGKFQNIETGSDGQRAAAMLALLLSADQTPLIIDQPEDDLDSKLISSLLVKEFRNLKRSCQIVTVTHNPNIPVNAASEQIVEMGYVKGQIVKRNSGALQRQEIRKAVCEIMEGGKQALQRRYFRVCKALS